VTTVESKQALNNARAVYEVDPVTGAPVGGSAVVATAVSTTIANTLTTPAAGTPLGPLTLVGIRLPSTFDGTTLTFTCSDTLGGTYDPVYDENGAIYAVPSCGASQYRPVRYDYFLGCLFIKPVSGAQTGDSILTLYVRPLA
jgi:hypothetical protein